MDERYENTQKELKYPINQKRCSTSLIGGQSKTEKLDNYSALGMIKNEKEHHPMLERIWKNGVFIHCWWEYFLYIYLNIHMHVLYVVCILCTYMYYI